MIKSRRFIFGAFASLILSLTIISTAFAAWVNLPATHNCAPTQGSFSWTQPYPTTYVEWYQHEKWTGSQYTCIHGAWDWYHMEVEAYNPGGGSSCDKLHTIYTNYTLPSRAVPSIANGCGSSSYKEEVKFWIKSSGIGNGTNYWTFTRFNKVNIAAGAHEVNWSFATAISDWWMGKIGYNITSGGGYNPNCSSPANILTNYPGCY